MYSERLKALRTEKGYTQAQVAALVSISPPSYAAYESGKSLPPLDKLIVLAKHYGVSLDWLCGIDKEESALRVETQGDVARFIIAMVDSGYFELKVYYNDREEVANINVSLINDSCEDVLKPTWFDRFILDYKKLCDLEKANTISHDVFIRWLASILKEMDKTKLEAPNDTAGTGTSNDAGSEPHAQEEA